MQLQFTNTFTLSPKRIQYHSRFEGLIFIYTAHCSITIPASLRRGALTFLMQVVISLSNDASVQGTFPSYHEYRYNFQLWTFDRLAIQRQGKVIYMPLPFTQSMVHRIIFFFHFHEIVFVSFVAFISSYSEMLNRKVRLYLSPSIEARMRNLKLAA